MNKICGLCFKIVKHRKQTSESRQRYEEHVVYSADM